MKRNERCRILIDGNGVLLKHMGQDIETHYTSRTIEIPNEGMVMIRMRDTARKTPFYLGEVLISEARAEVEGFMGLGMIKGHHPEKARQLALVDAAFNSDAERRTLWESWLEDEKDKINVLNRREEGRIRQSRVDFSTMDDQGVEIKHD